MAQVPRNDGFTVMPNERAAYQGAQFIDPSVPRQEFNLNKAADRIDAFVERQDNARVDDAITKLKQYALEQEKGEQGFLNLKGESAMQADSEGRGLVERIDSSLRQTGDEIGMGLTPRQQRLFRQKAETVYQTQFGAASQHVFQENRVWQENSRKGNIALSIEAAHAYYDRQDRLDLERKSIEENVRALGQLQGWGESMTKAQILKYTSDMYKGAIASALEQAEQNPALASKALDILNTNKHRMLGSDVLESRKVINARLDVHRKSQIAEFASKNAIIDMGSTNVMVMASTEGKPLKPEEIRSRASQIFMTHALDVLSAGGHQFDGNTKNTSVNKRGNEENWQYGGSRLTVKQAKKTAELMGEQFDLGRFMGEQGYNVFLGTETFNRLAQEYVGDFNKTMAAYYAGSDAVNKAIEKAKKEGNEGAWLSHLDTETQTIVANLGNAMKASQRYNFKDENGKSINALTSDYASAKARHVVVKEEDVRRKVKEFDPRARVDPVWNEECVQAAMNLVRSQQTSYEQTQRDNMNRAKEQLYASKGEISGISSSLWVSLDVDQQDALRTLGKKIADKDETSDMPLFYRLFTNDDLLRSMSKESLMSYRGAIAGKEWEQLEAKWLGLKEGQRQANDTRAVEQGMAQRGELSAKYANMTLSEVSTALEFVTPHDEWVKLKDDPERMKQYLAEAQMYAATHGQLAGKNLHGQAIPLQTVLADFRRNRVDLSDWWGTSKPVSQLVYKDFPSDGISDAKPLITTIADQYIASLGHNRKATESEKNEVIRKIFTLRDPGFNVQGVVMDKDLEADIRKRYRERYKKDPSTLETVRLYLLARVSGYEVPENKTPYYASIGVTGGYTADDYYGFFE